MLCPNSQIMLDFTQFRGVSMRQSSENIYIPRLSRWCHFSDVYITDRDSLFVSLRVRDWEHLPKREDCWRLPRS